MSAAGPAPGPAPPLVSVVMPVFDAEQTLAASMESVLAQTVTTLELLVIDDCSRDGSWACIERAAAADHRVVPLRLPRNAGVASARNAGIEAARGRYVAFLDSDDRWHPQKLDVQLRAMAAGDALASYAPYRRVDARGAILSVVRPPPRVDHDAMLKSNRIGNLTGLYARALGPMRFRRLGHEDYVFWLEVVRRAGHAIRAGAEPLADYLVRPGSLSSDKLRAARWQWRIYRDIERMDPARAAWYFAHYAGNALAKRR